METIEILTPQVLESIPMAACSCTEGGIVRQANTLFRSLFGLGDDLPPLAALLEEGTDLRGLAARSSAEGMRLTMRRASGESFPAQIRVSHSPAEGSVLLLVEDASGAAAAERELSRTRQMLEGIIEQSPMPICIGRASDGLCERYNKALVDVFGMPPPPHLNAFEDPYIEKRGMLEHFKQVLKGERVEIPDLKYDISQFLDGAPTAPVHVNMLAFPILDEAGEVERFVIIHEDVTREHRALQSYMATEAQYRAIVEDQTELICRFNSNGVITFGNRAFRAVQREEPLLWSLVHENDRPQVLDLLASLSDNREAGRIQFRMGGAETESIHVSATFRLVFTADGTRSASEYQMVARDITAELRQQSELIRAQRAEAMNLMAGGVAHDFNNILQTILGWGELLTVRGTLAERERDEVQAIVEAARQGASLTRQLLSLSREAGAPFETVEFTGIVRELQKMLARMIGTHHRLSLSLPAENLYLRGDRARLEQILLNLTVNARDAMQESGTCTVHLEKVTEESHEHLPPGEYLLLRVSDTGSGMDESTVHRIFEPFYTTKTAGAGTGLGLAIVSRVVEQHRGKILVTSAPGAGTIFSIYLPLVAPPAEEPADAHSETPFTAEGLAVLVEDVEEVRALLAGMLEQIGLQVICASDGLRAQELLAGLEEVPEVLVTDLLLPERNGLQVAEFYQQRWPEGKVLFLSGYSDSLLVHKAVGRPGSAFLRKPFGIAHLHDALRTILRPVEHRVNPPNQP